MWEDFWYVLLLESKLPRHRAYIEASAVLAFPQRRRRDAENFIPSVTKPLADTLVKGLWLPDDTPEFYRFTGLVFEAGPSSTKVTLVAR